MYRHLANIRKKIGARTTWEMLFILTDTKNLSFSHLRLSPRGKDVFLLILKGGSMEEIGRELKMTLSGVRRHKEKMLRANNCSSMKELVGKFYTHDQLEHHQSMSISEKE